MFLKIAQDVQILITVCIYTRDAFLWLSINVLPDISFDRREIIHYIRKFYEYIAYCSHRHSTELINIVAVFTTIVIHIFTTCLESLLFFYVDCIKFIVSGI